MTPAPRSHVVAVRALCEFTARTGDLDLRFTPAPSALEGMEGHRAVQQRRGAGYEAEVPLSGSYDHLTVRGRADGWNAALGQLEEIKTYRGTLDSVRPHHRALHWAQAQVYGHLLCQARGLAGLKLALVYVHATTHAETVLVQEHTAAALQAFFATQCQHYLAWAHSEAAHRQQRNAALARLRFPLPAFRAGQRELAVAVYRTAHPNAEGASAPAGRCLLAQAPTGIGKTLGTLFPLLKAMAPPAMAPPAMVSPAMVSPAMTTPGQGGPAPAAAASGAAADAVPNGDTETVKKESAPRLPSGLDKLFFLTAKGTGHGLALHALAQLQGALAPHAPGTPLRVLDLHARDKTCEHPGSACHGDACPLARGFFDRLPAARAAAVQQPAPWDAPTVRSVALQHGICPYYLSQELVRWADVVVADYHYYYDSAAMLYALTQQQGWRVAVLVDEAHNLLERARSMYTAPLSPFELAAARQAATGPVKKALDALHRQWNALNKTLGQSVEDADTPGAPGALHTGATALVPPLAATPSYQAHATVPPALLGAVQRAVGAMAEAQADQPLPPGDAVLVFYWSLLHFQALAEQFGPHALFDLQRVAAAPSSRNGRARTPATTLCIRNVMPAPHLAARHAAAQATVLFSGTLSPPQFYRDLLGLPPNTAWLDVAAPFAAHQLQVRVAPHISTRWRDREASLAPIADLVAAQYARQPGNYLCFASSFDYLQRVAATLAQRHPQVPQWQQTREMDDASRAAFLARFTEGGQGVGLAVLGGAFAEGVDLPGTRLIGAFIATLGLPQVNAVNDAMQCALDEVMGPGQGYACTYLYPGLRKVVQAAGRVIRTEQDRGVVVLMDDRFQRTEVRALLPRWWQVG